MADFVQSCEEIKDIYRGGDMNEGAPMMYHGSNGLGGAGVYVVQGQVERAPRQYPLEVLQMMGGSPGHGTPRRWQPRRDRPPNKENSAFGYDSDDSSLSSNASGCNKSCDKGQYEKQEEARRERERDAGGCAVAVAGAGAGGNVVVNAGGASREWRGRTRREQRPRRVAPDRHLHSMYPFQVKYTPDDLLNGSEFDTLSQEIWDKFIKSQQTEDIFRKKMNLWKYLFVTVRSVFPRYSLYVVGSTMSGFGLAASDMDLCLHVRAPPAAAAAAAEPRHHALLHLNYILGYVRAIDPDAELIQAKVPILKFRDARNGLQVDLNCNNLVGIRNTNLLHCFSRMDWRVRPLVAAGKLWARAHGINDARRRTLSSYALTLMVLHFLQCGTSPPLLPRASEAGAAGAAGAARPHNRATLGELFLNFLHYYAHFPYESMMVSVREGRRVPLPPAAHPTLLCVEEPFDLSNTARSVYDPETFEKIVSTFKESYKRLSAGMRLADAWPAR